MTSKLKRLRLEKGWSQEQLAELSGLSTRTIQRLEKGEKAGLESLKALAAIFEVPVSELKSDLSAETKEETTGMSEQGQTSHHRDDSKQKGIEDNSYIPRKWRGLAAHVLALMIVTTWALFLARAFDLDGELVLFAAFVWALILGDKAYSLAYSDEESDKEVP